MRGDFILIYNANYPNIPAFFTLLLNKGSIVQNEEQSVAMNVICYSPICFNTSKFVSYASLTHIIYILD